MLCIEHGVETTELIALPTFTRRGSREAYHRLQRQMMNRFALDGAPHHDDAMLVAARLERGRIVERVRIPYGDEGPDAGVREPRRPRPSSGPAQQAR
jgi:hypothetical protein